MRSPTIGQIALAGSRRTRLFGFGLWFVGFGGSPRSSLSYYGWGDIPSQSSRSVVTCGAVLLGHCRSKKSRRGKASNCSPTSAYSLTNLPAAPGCPSSRHPTTCNVDYPLRIGECKCLPTPTLGRNSSVRPLDRPHWCILSLAGTFAIISKRKTLHSPNQAHQVRQAVRRMRVGRAAGQGGTLRRHR